VVSKEALESQDWLHVSFESILEFLDMECLNIDEADLVRALIRWGKFQTQQSGDDAVENLRNKILPGLQKIRFSSFTQLEVTQLCEEELKEVLTGDEKCSILLAIIKGDWELMPNDIVSSIKLSPRNEPYIFYSLPYAADTNQNHRLTCFHEDALKCFRFKVDKEAAIVGIKLNLTAPFHKLITFSLRENDSDALKATGSSNITSLHKGEVFCPFNYIETLIPNKWYRVYFEFLGLIDESSCHRCYCLPDDKNTDIICDGRTLTVDKVSISAHILGIVFRN
jgi:BTB And C-terminal Kelch